MNKDYNQSLETQTMLESTQVDHTLETQSISSQDSPRLSFSSISSLVSQSIQQVQENDVSYINSQQQSQQEQEPIKYDDIKPLESDMLEIFTKEEQYYLIILMKYRKILEESYSFKVMNHQSQIHLDDPTPYIYKESDSIPIPSIKPHECVIVDRAMLQKREEVLRALDRPYHPLFYTSFSESSS